MTKIKWLILLLGISLTADSCTGCPDGTFGEDCASSCDGHHCVGGSSTCSEVDGTCPGDCEQWYTELTCSQFIRLPKLEIHNNVTVTPENSSTLRVYWQKEDYVDTKVAPFIGYVVEYKRDGAQHYNTSLAVPHVDGRDYLSTVISGLQYNTKYTVRIRVYREQRGIREISDWPTGEVTAMTACTVPDAPFGVTVKAVTTSYATVQWQIGDSGCNSITSVEVLYRRQGRSQWMHHGVAYSNTAMLTDLEEGSYEVKMIVTNDASLSVETQPTSINVGDLWMTNDPMHVTYVGSKPIISCNDQHHTIIALGVINGLLVIVIIVGLLVFVLYRRQVIQQRQMKVNSAMSPSKDDSYEHFAMPSSPDAPTASHQARSVQHADVNVPSRNDTKISSISDAADSGKEQPYEALNNYMEVPAEYSRLNRSPSTNVQSM